MPPISLIEARLLLKRKAACESAPQPQAHVNPLDIYALYALLLISAACACSVRGVQAARSLLAHECRGGLPHHAHCAQPQGSG